MTRFKLKLSGIWFRDRQASGLETAFRPEDILQIRAVTGRKFCWREGVSCCLAIEISYQAMEETVTSDQPAMFSNTLFLFEPHVESFNKIIEQIEAIYYYFL